MTDPPLDLTGTAPVPQAGTVPHESARRHVTGSAEYVDDMPEPAGTLHAAIGMASVAHGLIRSIDLEAARAAPGVVAVLTAVTFPAPIPAPPPASCRPAAGP